MKPSISTPPGATVVITHHVRDGKQADYEIWLEEIVPICQSYPGHLDWQLVPPIPGLSESYTFIIRFDTIEHLRHWMESDDRRRLIKKVRPLLKVDDRYEVRSGLDFWFTSANSSAETPSRFWQSIITLSALYPLVLIVPLVMNPMLHPMGWDKNIYISTFFITAAIVFLMTYAVMPYYTRLFRRWL